jgi:hypothetical protein
MGFFDIFRKKKSDNLSDTLVDLSLDKLMVGCMVDYDLKTWEVTAHHHTDWGDQFRTEEWQLKSYDEVIYLEKEEDDEVEWSISRNINFHLLGPHVPENILSSGDPPQTVTYDGIAYTMTESSGGHFFKNGIGPGQPMLAWDYENDSKDAYLTIEQWGENEFEAFLGQPVEEYQFTNILPPQSK